MAGRVREAEMETMPESPWFRYRPLQSGFAEVSADVPFRGVFPGCARVCAPSRAIGQWARFSIMRQAHEQFPKASI